MVVLLTKSLIAERDRCAKQLPPFQRNGGKIFVLSYEDVLDAHFCIADFFVREDYGLGGIGPRSVDGLISTVERQFFGFQGHEVFATDYEKVASLMYGIIKNHPFYDANKRTAFLCALLQLHRMGRQICVKESEFENLMVDVADGSIEKKSALRELRKKGVSHPEIRFLGRYLEKSSRKTARLNKSIKFRELRAILNQNGFDFDNQNKRSIDIVKLEEKRIPRFWLKDRIEKTRKTVGNIAYHGEGFEVPDNTLKMVRQLCGLSDQDGFDGEVLLRDAQPTFQLINSYRMSLQRLAYR